MQHYWALLCCFSFEQGFELNQKLLRKVHVIYKATFALNVVKWILIVLGLCIGAASLWIVKKRTDMQSLNLPGISQTVRNVTPVEDGARYWSSAYYHRQMHFRILKCCNFELKNYYNFSATYKPKHTFLIWHFNCNKPLRKTSVSIYWTFSQCHFTSMQYFTRNI